MVSRTKIVLLFLAAIVGAVVWSASATLSPAAGGQGKMESLAALGTGSQRHTYGWHTFYGTDSKDEGRDIAVDGDGNVYVTGTSAASWLGDGDQPPLHPYSGSWDIVVVKLDRAGAYQWHTFYGSAEKGDQGLGIAVDASGNVYVTGGSAGSWLGDGGQVPLNEFYGRRDLVVLKLDGDGAYQWHTFFGGELLADGVAAAVGGHDQAVYVSGVSTSPWQGPGGEGPLHPHSGSSSIGYGDLLVLKLDSSGTYQWHTFYGQPTNDDGHDIAVDEQGDAVYVAGWSDNAWTGDGGVEPIHDFTGFAEAVVLKLDEDGTYQWHTFYGSDTYDYAYGVALDGKGDVYLAGGADATWPGDAGQEPLHDFGDTGFQDIMVMKLDSAGAYQWHTFYGAAGYNDGSDGIAVDASGNLLVAGASTFNWLGDGDVDPGNHLRGGEDLMVLKLSSGGAYLWHTFHGSAISDHGFAVAVDDAGIPYVTGTSYETWLGNGEVEPLHPHSPGNSEPDLVVLQLSAQRVVYLPFIRR
jgi:hypothetical protein